MNHEELQARVTKLERYNRLLFGGIVFGFLLVFLIGAVPEIKQKQLPDGDFRIVRASKFEVVDPRTGITRATLDHQTAPNGWAALHFYDNQGQPRVWVKLYEDGEANISLLDGKKRIQYQIGIDNNGTASTAMNKNENWVYMEEMKRKGVQLNYSGK